jgi:hypothetical protein
MDKYDQRINKLKKIVIAYKAHLEEDAQRVKKIGVENYLLASMDRHELAQLKSQIVLDMEKIMERQDINSLQKLEELKKFLVSGATKNGKAIIFSETKEQPLTNKSILKQHRSGLLFLERILHVLSLGIYSKATKGTFQFWKSHGNVLANKMSHFTKDLPEANKDGEKQKDKSAIPSQVNVEMESKEFTPQIHLELRKCFEENASSNANIRVECTSLVSRYNHGKFPEWKSSIENDPNYFLLVGVSQSGTWGSRLDTVKADTCKALGLTSENSNQVIVIGIETIFHQSQDETVEQKLVAGFEEKIKEALTPPQEKPGMQL